MNYANLLSGLRLALTPSAILAIIFSQWYLLLGLVLVAGVTDLLDGYVARKTKETKLGKMLDPLADKIFFGFILIALIIFLNLPLYYFLILTREFSQLIFAVGGVLIGKLKIKKAKLIVTKISKLTTFLQVVVIFILILSNFYDLNLVLLIIIILTSLLAIISAVQYSIRTVKQYN